MFLETTREKWRAFGNAWIPNNAIIFKGSRPTNLYSVSFSSHIFSDVCGKLEGESIVGGAIQDTLSLWCFKEPPRIPRSPTRSPTLSPDRNNPSPSATGTLTRSAGGLQIQDWRNPIYEMLEILKSGRNLDINIRIIAKPPSNSGHSYSAPSSPTPQPPCGRGDGSLLPIMHSQSLPPSLHTEISASAPSAGPPTPSSYGTARNTPLSERSPVAGPSTSISAPLQRAPSITAQPALIAALPPPVPPKTSLPLIGQATPVPSVAHAPSEMSPKREPRGIAFSQVALSSSQVPAPEVPLSGTINAMSREIRRIPRPHVAGDLGEVDRRLSILAPDTYPEHTYATSRALPPGQELARVSQRQAQKRKKNWVQKYIVDPCKKLSGSLHHANPSTPEPAER